MAERDRSQVRQTQVKALRFFGLILGNTLWVFCVLGQITADAPRLFDRVPEQYRTLVMLGGGMAVLVTWWADARVVRSWWHRKPRSNQ